MSRSEHRMMAAAAIQEAQVLLQVPDTLFMTANTAVKSKLCGKLVKAAELPEWQVRTWAGQHLHQACSPVCSCAAVTPIVPSATHPDVLHAALEQLTTAAAHQQQL
jgi:hypothetical protein